MNRPQDITSTAEVLCGALVAAGFKVSAIESRVNSALFDVARDGADTQHLVKVYAPGLSHDYRVKLEVEQEKGVLEYDCPLFPMAQAVEEIGKRI